MAQSRSGCSQEDLVQELSDAVQCALRDNRYNRWNRSQSISTYYSALGCQGLGFRVSVSVPTALQCLGMLFRGYSSGLG